MIYGGGNLLMANVAEALPSLDEVARGTRSQMGAALPVLVIVLGILFVALIWAVFFRRPRTGRQRGTILEETDGEPASGGGRRRRRRRRRDHRPRNPTLAETGGLPPARVGEPPPPIP